MNITKIGLFSFMIIFSTSLMLFSQETSPDQEEQRIIPSLNMQELKENASGFSLGILFGEPAGLSAKVTWPDSMALDAALAWSFLSDNPGLYVHSNLLYHLNGFQMDNGAFFRPFVGIGGAINIESDFKIALRIPLGLSYYFTMLPLEVFIEAAPGLLLFPETSAYFAGGIGIRYRFKSEE
jgi:hypothetical protein